jgi:hypothetical protein
MVVFDDMEPEQKVTIYEKRVSPTGEAFSGDVSTPAIDMTEPLRRECTYFLELVAGEHDRIKVARDGARVVRALEMLTTSLKGNAALTEPLPDLATLSDVDLTKLIDELTLEEPDISNRRRLLHGKIDILRAELYDRLANGEGSTGG